MNGLDQLLAEDSPTVFLTDGGLETTLVFLQGIDLPCFAAFDLLNDTEGYEAIKNYYLPYLELAMLHSTGFILESPTWRANPDWVEKLGHLRSATGEINQSAIALMNDLRNEFADSVGPLVVSGCIGPRGDGYQADTSMSADEAREYHSEQVKAFAASGVDIISAITMTNVDEAIGIARAAGDVGIPSVISFTVETDGKLPSGDELGSAIEQTDANADVRPAYYMINCAHPTHFANVLADAKDAAWINRIGGIRANASVKSHAELDESTELDRGNVDKFGSENADLKKSLPNLRVFGGCCGTDDSHVAAIAREI